MIQSSNDITSNEVLKDIKHYCIDCSGHKEDRIITCSLTTCSLHKWRKYFVDLDKVIKVEKVETGKEELSDEDKKKLKRNRKKKS